ncbi:hypothetical protein LINGRAHAP2_LOCUS14236 [Linum grandiflorum]
MSLLRNGIRSTFALRTSTSRLGSPWFLRDSANHFSTEAGQPPSPPEASSVNPFLQTPGVVYGRLFGGGRHTLKTDIINLLEGCNLGIEDIKFSYVRGFTPNSVLLQFPSRQSYEHAFKVIARKGRIYRVQRAERGEWDLQTPYYGKTVLLQGVPPNAVPEDIERFLSGCDFDPVSIQFTRQGIPPNTIRSAVVRFESPVQAMNAFISKNGGFCLNRRVWMRVVQ